jgi:hypothetical protein
MLANMPGSQEPPFWRTITPGRLAASRWRCCWCWRPSRPPGGRVFVLREVFDVAYGGIAEAVGKIWANTFAVASFMPTARPG